MNKAAKTASAPLPAQQAAADPAASVWVSANAGAGKTRVLTERVIRLMLGGTPPARLLCLTFTKAAAAEMANRLHQRLGAWSTAEASALRNELSGLLGRPVDAEELPAARQLFARALDTPGGLKIQTIHAFSESLLRRFPLEANVAPHFEVVDERTAAELLEDARDAMLRQAQTETRLTAALENVVSRVDEQGFADLVGELATKRGRVRRLLIQYGGHNGLVDALRARLGLAGEDTAESLLEAACGDAAFNGNRLRRAASALALGSAKDRERSLAINAFLDAGAARTSLYPSYRQVFLTKKGLPSAEKNLITKAARESDPTALPTLIDEQARILEVEARCRSAAIADRTTALLILGEVLLDAYQAEKKRRALLDYDDLILATRALLHRPDVAPWVLFKLDGGLDHILVDEAQDTSPEQWEVIAALANEFFTGSGAREDRGGPVRTVFAVGDEKQSVYSFQGADPRRFDAMRRHFEDRVVAAEQAWRPIDLVLSFRSVSAVLGALDAVFQTPEARDGVSATDRPIQHLAWRDAAPGLVELWPPIQPEEQPEQAPWDLPLDMPAADSPRAQLADRIAGRVAAWLDEGETLAARGREIRPGDIMILVRRRDAFVEEMVRQLKERGIPVAGTDRMVLTEQIAVMDLIALGNFLLLPDDDLTLATVLKGPLYGFDEDDLFDLAYERKGFLWQTLRERRGDRPRYEAACVELETLLARADFVPPFEFFSELLGARGGRRRLLARLGPDAADPIDEFLTLCLGYERVRAPSLQGFLHWIEAGRAEIKRDLEQGRDEVRVMTVHGAKGLEAPVVFLPDTCSAPAGHYDPRLLSLPDPTLDDADAPLLAWPAKRVLDDDHTAAARLAARAEAMREYRRLLYVAMSRAEDRLYICGFDGKKARHPDCWYDLVAEPIKAMAREIELPFGETGWRVQPADATAVETEPPQSATTSPTPPPAWIAKPAPAEPRPPKPLAPSRPDSAEPATLSPLGGDAGRRFRRGLLIHRLLETLPDLPPERRIEAARRWLANPVHGLDPSEQARTADEVLAVLEDPATAGLFGPNSRAEVPVTGQIGERVISGQIDRLAIGDRAILVADYKTHRPPPSDVADVPQVYLAQMAAYRAILAGIYPDRSIACMLIWTDGPHVMPLPDDLLQATGL